MNSILLIPIYEPTNKTTRFIHDLIQTLPNELVIVDDGSGAEYTEIFDQMQHPRIHLIRYDKNIGKGHALKTGFEYIAENFPTVKGIITADGDGQHSISDIKKMLAETIKLTHHEILLGVRDFSYQETPFRSYFGNKLTSLFYFLASGIRLQDTQTGLRGFSSTSIHDLLSIAGDRFEYEINQLLELPSSGYHIKTLPIETIYEDNNQQSHFRPLQDSFLVYQPLLRFLFSSLTSSFVDLSLFYGLVLLTGGKSPAALLTITVIARITSGVYNYHVNRRFVFQKRKGKAAFFKYSLLFLVQLVFSWLGVSTLSLFIRSLLFCKLSVDITLFFASFAIQRRMIFKGGEIQ